MMERIRKTSPRFEASLTGAFHLLTVLTGIFAQGFPERQPGGRQRRRGYGDQHTDAQESVSVGFRSLPHRNGGPGNSERNTLGLREC